MRQGIYKDVDGVRTVDILKANGKCYANGWFTNTQGIRYRLFKGSRNSKKSFNMIGNEVVIRMISDDVTNILICRKNDVDNRNSNNSFVTKFDLSSKKFMDIEKKDYLINKIVEFDNKYLIGTSQTKCSLYGCEYEPLIKEYK